MTDARALLLWLVAEWHDALRRTGARPAVAEAPSWRG